MIGLVATISTVLIWGVTPLNQAFRGLGWTATKTARYAQETFGDLGFVPKPGDKVAGYPVTSGFGKRTSPCAGCSSNHNGIDLGTPIGTPVYLPVKQGENYQIRCRQPHQTGGGGLVAEVLVPSRGVLYQNLHLSQCSEKTMAGGRVFARTGASGVGTGPHLDLRKAKTAATDINAVPRPLEYEGITAYEAWWFLKGDPPKEKGPKK